MTPSRRQVSRSGGGITAGTVYVVRTEYVTCESCGAPAPRGHTHAPHYHRGVLVDCVGRAIK